MKRMSDDTAAGLGSVLSCGRDAGFAAAAAAVVGPVAVEARCVYGADTLPARAQGGGRQRGGGGGR